MGNTNSRLLFLPALVSTSAFKNLVLQAAKNTGRKYDGSTVVFLSAVSKLAICVSVLLGVDRYRSFFLADWATIRTAAGRWTLLKYAFPSFAFFVQNNFYYYMIKHINPSQAQLLSQLRVVFLAVALRIFAGKTQTNLQSSSLLVLMTGCILSQMNTAAKESESLWLVSRFGVSLSIICSLLDCVASVSTQLLFQRDLKSTANTTEQIPARQLPASPKDLPVVSEKLPMVSRTADASAPTNKNVSVGKPSNLCSFFLRAQKLYLFGVLFNALELCRSNRYPYLKFYPKGEDVTLITTLLATANGLCVGLVSTDFDVLVKQFCSSSAVIVTQSLSLLLNLYQGSDRPDPRLLAPSCLMIISSLFAYNYQSPKSS